MLEIDGVLRKYYGRHVRFPDKFEEVKAELPAALQSDPWGDPWTYSPKGPAGFSQKFATQRYSLAPSRHPQVRPVAEVLKSAPPPRAWQLTAKSIAGQRVLEFRLASGKTVATQAGGAVEDATLLHIGDGWALMSDTERLFTVTF